MQNLTPEGLRIVTDIAARHGVSVEAALTLLGALARSHGAQAQFNHPELGGMGQWSEGGMIMIGDMFNSGSEGSGRCALHRACRAAAQPAFRGGLRRAFSGAKPQPERWRRRQPVRGGRGSERFMVASGARRAGLDRRPERHAIRLVSRAPPACDR